ncbi:myotubularin-related protein 10-like [Diadema setosum]|uniref:myotubularin-related protein 10-like n=1 Tax=Diadema setosum TaxID=31175 RepID=UPI003B3B233D
MSIRGSATFKSYLNESTFVETGSKRSHKITPLPRRTTAVLQRFKPSNFTNIIDDASKDGDVVQTDPPEILDGEIIISHTPNVLKFDSYNGLNRGISGSLFCTNFKISFVTANRPAQHVIELDHRNHLFKENDIPLTAVSQIFQVSSGKKRQMLPGSGWSSNAKLIEIRCKNFKVHMYSFKFAPRSAIKSMIHTILHHAFPTNPQLLFAFAFKPPSNSPNSRPRRAESTHGGITNGHEAKKALPVRSGTRIKGILNPQPKYTPFKDSITSAPPPPPPNKPDRERHGRTPQFRRQEDWEHQIKRTGARNVRVTEVNRDFRLSDSLPEYFVVPDPCSDYELKSAAANYEDGRVPFWCWSHRNGSMLMRMTSLYETMISNDTEKGVMDGLTLIHPAKVLPAIIDLSRECPSIQDLQTGYLKLQSMCMPENIKDFWTTDEKWYSTLDSTKWLQTIGTCLSLAKQAADLIYLAEQTVILKEHQGRDYSCVVSSLVQIMLDSHFRSQLGFQTLIQKEWIVAGHPFLDRCGHCEPSNGQEAPLFLLFLDCVHQLIEQFPSAFEFTDTFLIALWDSMHSGIFGTFLFNSERQRTRTCVSINKGQYETKQLATVWAWTLQFTKDDQALFTNPLYIAKSELNFNDNSLDDEGDFSQGCNAGIYRSIRRLNNGKTLIGSDFKEMDSWTFNGGKRRKNPNINGANSASSAFSSWEEEIIIPVLQTPTISFWTHCYLRWVPSVHTVGGGSPAVYQQQCKLVDEIQQLRETLDNLRRAKENITTPPTKPKRRSRLFFTSQDDVRRNHESLTSAFPFTISDLEFLGGDRRSFLATPLARFLGGQSLLEQENENSESDIDVTESVEM